MILADIRQYLRDRSQASLADIANHFDADPGAVRSMLEVWIRKGRVARHVSSSNCNSCNRCDPLTTEIYSWLAVKETTEQKGH